MKTVNKNNASINLYYKHTRSGEIYEIVSFAEHTETHEKFVIYKRFKKHEYDPSVVWARPVDNFMGETVHNGELVQRFIPVHNVNEIFTENELQELIDAKNADNKSNIDHCVLYNVSLFDI